MTGKFITFEGGEGVGKSTQCTLLSDALRAKGIEVCQTREPGGAPGAEDIRALLVNGEPGRWDAETETLLHFAARRNHVMHTVKPALEKGAWVVCDRFVDSTVAYQGYVGGVDREVIEDLYRFAAPGIRPDLTLVLDMEPAQGLLRASERGEGEDRYERMGDVFHAKLREAFLDIAAHAPERCTVIDASTDVETVAAHIRATVGSHFDLVLA